MTEERRGSSELLTWAVEWPFPIRLLFFIVWLIFGVGIIWFIRPIWWLIALSAIVGYLLQPPIGYLTRLRIPRALATVISLLVLLLIVSLLPVVLVPALFADIAPISIDFAGILDGLIQWVQRLPQTFPGFTFLSYDFDLTPIYREIAVELASLETQTLLPSATNLANIVREVISSTMQVVSFATVVATSVIGRFFGSLISTLLLILLTFYIAADLPKIGDKVGSFAPPAYQREWRELWRRTGMIWNAFFRGQIILSTSIGVAVWAGLSIIGVPGALALGVLSGVLEVIPNLGPVLAAIPALLLALLQGSTNYPEASHLTIMVITIAFYIGIQQVENLFLVPRILGQSVGIHPALVLVGVAAFTFQFGILGAFVATPTIATLQLWFSYFHARILLQEPFTIITPPLPSSSANAPPEEAAAPTGSPEKTSPESELEKETQKETVAAAESVEEPREN